LNFIGTDKRTRESTAAAAAGRRWRNIIGIEGRPASANFRLDDHYQSLLISTVCSNDMRVHVTVRQQKRWLTRHDRL
jgi:hypothetical protein